MLFCGFTRRGRARGGQWGPHFLFGYGIFRTIAEFFREPDAHIGFDMFGWLSRGQLLSIPMIIIGAVLLVHAYRSADPKGQQV